MESNSRITAAMLAVALLAAPWAKADPAPVSATRTTGAFSIDTLADGVHLFRPTAGAGERANSLVVEREDGLLVVDAQPSPAAAQELLAAIATQSDKPIRFLVLSHPHADAAGGASAFPGKTLVVASEGCRSSLADPKYDFGAEARARARETSSWTEPPRPSPNVIPAAALRLEDRRNTVVVLPVPVRSHSAGDLVVSVPGAGVVAVGDLIAVPRNLFPGDANIGDWLNTLGNVLQLAPKSLVPLRGAAVDPREAALTREALAWARGQVAAAFGDRVPSGKITERVLSHPDLPRYFDTGSTPSFVGALLDLVVEEAIEDRRRFGVDSP